MEYHHTVKLLLIGDSNVGKSSILNSYSDEQFSPYFISTIGVDFKIKNVKRDGKNIRVQVWDTAGQERFRTITSSYYRGAHGIIVVYDVNNAESLNNVSYWLHEVLKQSNMYRDKPAPLIVVGNKSEGMTEENKTLSHIRDYKHFYVSAKTGAGVKEMFAHMIEEVMVGVDLEEKKFEDAVQLVEPVQKPPKRCC